MKNIGNFIIKYRKIILGIFSIILLICAFTFNLTKINYDMSKYLPANSKTAQGITVMQDEFGAKGSAKIMIENISLEETQRVLSDLEKIDGIEMITFDSNNGYDYTTDSALFNVILQESDSAKLSTDAIGKIEKYLADYDAYIVGNAATNYYCMKLLDGEMTIIIIIVLIIVGLILFLTSSSYIEILIFIIVFGAAALLNMGTNFLLGEISYITNSIAIILQLALAIDYAIIFLHRYTEESKNLKPIDASREALKKAIPEILSSSLTTISGLIAIMFMQLQIGLDLGMVLAKGVIFSMLTVFLLMPAIVLIFSKTLVKTKHKRFIPSVKKASYKILKSKIFILPLFIIIVIGAFILQTKSHYVYDSNNVGLIAKNEQKISETFGISNNLVILIEKSNTEKELNLIKEIEKNDLINDISSFHNYKLFGDITLFTPLSPSYFAMIPDIDQADIELLFIAYVTIMDPANIDNISSYQITLYDLMMFVTTHYEEIGLTEDDIEIYEEYFNIFEVIRNNFEGKNYNRIIININSGSESKETYETIKYLQSILDENYDNYYLLGNQVNNLEVKNSFSSDNILISILTVVFILIILLFTFKNLLIPIILTITIQGAIWINFAIFAAFNKPMFYLGFLIVSAIQMGATIDYAILLTNRYLQNKNEDRKEAMATAVDEAFATIITSGLILALCGLSLGLLSTDAIVSTLGYLLGIGTIISMVLVLFVLPQLLLILNKFIIKVNFKISRKSK